MSSFINPITKPATTRTYERAVPTYERSYVNVPLGSGSFGGQDPNIHLQYEFVQIESGEDILNVLPDLTGFTTRDDLMALGVRPDGEATGADQVQSVRRNGGNAAEAGLVFPMNDGKAAFASAGWLVVFDAVDDLGNAEAVRGALDSGFEVYAAHDLPGGEARQREFNENLAQLLRRDTSIFED